jgi:site-specific DNA-methyltransferase (adenine-specific)
LKSVKRSYKSKLGKKLKARPAFFLAPNQMIIASKTGYSDKWATPPSIYAPLNAEFQFNYDPCPITWKEGDPDALEADWGTSTFCNPPYSIVAKFVKKASEEAQKGKTIVLLINACTDTKWFHEYIWGKAEIRFIRGRISFVDPKNPDKKQAPAPRPSMLVVFRPPA